MPWVRTTVCLDPQSTSATPDAAEGSVDPVDTEGMETSIGSDCTVIRSVVSP